MHESYVKSHASLHLYLSHVGSQQALKALSFADKLFQDKFRRPKELGVPYMNHMLNMCLQAWSMGIRDDSVLTAILLHDVCEDCGVAVKDLPADDKVKGWVEKLTRLKDERADDYYDNIKYDSTACLIKCLDRIDNLRDAPGGFSMSGLADYLDDTETYFPGIVEACSVDYGSQAWTLGYQINGLVGVLWALVNK